MSENRILFVNGQVFDGTGAPPVPADVMYPELRKRGLRVLPGGDYGFPNNPIGRNARDLDLRRRERAARSG